MRKATLAKLLVLACSLVWGQAIAGAANSPQEAISNDDTAELTFLHSKGLNWHPIDLSTGLVFFQVKIGERQVWGILDNGSDSTYVDSSLAKELGSAITTTDKDIRTAFGGFKALRTDRLTLTIPGQFTINSRFSAADLQPQSEATGKKIGLVLGADVIDRFAYVIDFVQNRMAFVPSGSMNFSKVKNTTIPLQDRSFRGQVNNMDAVMRVDLGSTSALVISDKRWDDFFEGVKTVSLGRSIDGAGNVDSSIGVRNIHIRIDKIEMISDVEKGSQIAPEVDGYIGVPFFRGKAAYFDYPNGRILIFTGD